MKKTAIFEDVVSIMTQDSSTIKDRKGCDPEPFREKITDDMTDDAFLYQVRSYLASFGVIGHVSFGKKKAPNKGFLLRSTDDGLFVEGANEDTGLQVGDQILALDGSDLEQVASLHKDYFISKTPERHYREWADLVSQSTRVTLLREGAEKTIEVAPSREPIQDQIFWKRLDDEILYLRLDNFMDEGSLGRLYQECLPMMTEVKFLIIDVRRNSGGTDSLYLPLLHLGLEKDQGYDSLDWDDDGMEILYTERNVDLRLKDFEDWMQQEEISPETAKLLEAMKEGLLRHRGKGYVPYQQESEEFFPEVRGGQYPEQIFILSDIYCRSSGDNFVQMMKQFKKVTVVGRPTLGILDYSNCCTVDYGDYRLMFPTSRCLSLDQGKGMTDQGVEPDIEVPWSPDHFERDVDLDKCLELIRQSCETAR